MSPAKPGPPPSREQRLATWISCGVFFSSFVPLLLERVAFDDTLGEAWLVVGGIAVALVLAIPSVALLWRMKIARGDRIAAGIFLALGIGMWCVPALTWINHAFAREPHHVEELTVLEKKYEASGKNSGAQSWLRVAYQGDDQWVLVSADDFDRAREGKPFALDVARGALGLPVLGCAECR